VPASQDELVFGQPFESESARIASVELGQNGRRRREFVVFWLPPSRHARRVAVPQVRVRAHVTVFQRHPVHNLAANQPGEAWQTIG